MHQIAPFPRTKVKNFLERGTVSLSRFLLLDWVRDEAETFDFLLKTRKRRHARIIVSMEIRTRKYRFHPCSFHRHCLYSAVIASNV